MQFVSEAKHREISTFMPFFNCDITCNWTDVSVLKLIIEKERPDVLTLSTTFYDLSVLGKVLSKAETHHFGVADTAGFNKLISIATNT